MDDDGCIVDACILNGRNGRNRFVGIMGKSCLIIMLIHSVTACLNWFKHKAEARKRSSRVQRWGKSALNGHLHASDGIAGDMFSFPFQMREHQWMKDDENTISFFQIPSSLSSVALKAWGTV